MKNGIIRVLIENFKKIRHIDTTLDGQSILLIGDNEVGKSSFMQAVFTLLGAKPFPEKTITTGEQNGKIEIEFVVDGKKYNAARKFTEANPDGYFEITTDDGLKTSRVGYLESLIGDISFNPFEFVEMARTKDGQRKQMEFVRKLIAPEINQRIDAIGRDHKLTFESRTGVNAMAKQLNAEIASISVPFPPEVYETPVDVNQLMFELKAANDANGKRNNLRDEGNRLITDKTNLEGKMTRLRNELKAAELEHQKTLDRMEQIREELKTMPPVLTADIESKIKNATAHNSQVATLQRYNTLKGQYQKATADAKSLTDKLEDLTKEKTDLIHNAGLPVPGLSFDESGLFFNGLPLEESQISTSVIMEIGVRLSVALNPKLKILRIPRGESLGKKRFDEIVEFATANGYQLFVERVESGVENLTIQFIEQ